MPPFNNLPGIRSISKYSVHLSDASLISQLNKNQHTNYSKQLISRTLYQIASLPSKLITLYEPSSLTLPNLT